MTDAYLSILQKHFSWNLWEQLIRTEGVTLDRPRRTVHPKYPEIIYPLDYGFIRNTTSSDGAEVDVFMGSGVDRLVGLIATSDYRQGDQEIKLLWRCCPSEVYMAHGFINFDTSKLKGRLVMRYPMKTLWNMQPLKD